MTEAEVISAMRTHLEGLFPKVCSNCQCLFVTLRKYLQNTTHLGPAIPYDAERGDWNPLHPMGIVMYAVCSCGTTLALSSKGMPLPQFWSLMNWARAETQRLGITPRESLNYVRDEICKQVLAAPDQADS